MDEDDPDPAVELDEATLVSSARHSAQLFSQTAALAIIAVDPLAAGVADENEAAAASAAAAQDYFDDGSCVAAEVSPDAPNQLVLGFDDCDGPYGLADVTGEVSITFAREGDGFSVALASTGELVVGDVSINIAGSVAIPDLADPRTIVVRTESRVSWSDTDLLSHDGSFELSWNFDLCFTLSGQLATRVGDATLSTTIDGLRRCRADCPEGTVTLGIGSAGSTDERTLEVVFDGDFSAEVIVTTPDSMHSVPAPIFCR